MTGNFICDPEEFYKIAFVSTLFQKICDLAVIFGKYWVSIETDRHDSFTNRIEFCSNSEDIYLIGDLRDEFITIILELGL